MEARQNQCPEAGESRKGRREGLPGKSGRGAEGNCLAHLAGEPAELPTGTPSPKPHPGLVGPGGIGGRPGGLGEAGWRSHPGGGGEEQKVIAPPTRAQETC